MGKGSSKAPDPDPNIGRAALMQAETGQQFLDFSKEAWKVSNERQAELDALTKRVTEQQLGVAEDQAKWARSDRERYETVFKPIEDQFIDEATNYATAERQAQAAAEAKGDVQVAAAGARDAAQRNAASMGINPTSGRYAGIDRATELGTAMAEAGAANTARQAVRDKGLALKADVANMGRGLPSQSAQAQALGLNASSGAVGLNQGANQQYIASTGIMGQGYSGAMQGYAGMGQTLNTQYGNQINAWQAEQSAKNSAWGGIGQVLGAGLGFLSDENLKENKKEIPDGDALEAVENMPVEEWNYKDGVADEGQHVGTYAQDFQRETGKGDGKSINAQDAIGITMKAVQDVSRELGNLAKAVGISRDALKGKKRSGKPSNQAIGVFA